MQAGNQVDGCHIWPRFPAVGFTREGGLIDVEQSPRAGGKYSIDLAARLALQETEISDRARARLTAMLVDQREERRVEWPTVTQELVERALVTPAQPVHERADRLLRLMTKDSQEIGEEVDIGCEGARNSHGEWLPVDSRSMWNAMAWSESVNPHEVRFLFKYLQEQGWIEANFIGDMCFRILVTVDGYRRVSNTISVPDSSQAFVAMWLDPTLDEAYEKGIVLGIQEAGYKPMRIDQKEFIDRIDDQIIAEIRRSRFVVADFTHGEQGSRGGVYYEAGFAHGLNLPVIFTCREDQVKCLHFDTNHYVHIKWTTPEDLRRQLSTRILSVIQPALENAAST